MKVKAVRGATGVAKDNREAIVKSIDQLFTELAEKNNLKEEQVVSIIFSVTRDLRSCNPASALRKFGYSKIPLFCMQEPRYKGSMKRLVRVMVTFNTENDFTPIPIYINGAEKLRPDLAEKN